MWLHFGHKIHTQVVYLCLRVYMPQVQVHDQSTMAARIGSLAPQEVTAAMQALDSEDELLHPGVVRVAGLLLPHLSRSPQSDSHSTVGISVV